MNILTADSIRAALTSTNGNVTEAAKVLGVTRVTVYKWMRRYNIEVERTVKPASAA